MKQNAGCWDFYILCAVPRTLKIYNLIFQLCSKLYYVCEYKLPWLMEVHSLLDRLGLSYIWSNHLHSIQGFKRAVKQRLRDQFIQEWQSSRAENSVCCNYRLFEKKFCFDHSPICLRQRVLKYRLSNHTLPIQHRRSLGIPRDERICSICDNGEVGDYLHNCSSENVSNKNTYKVCRSPRAQIL